MKKPKVGELYYHFKHNPDVVNSHSYEIAGYAFSCDSDREVIMYRPLYESEVIVGTDRKVFTRDTEIFMSPVEKDGRIFNRFTKITDSETIKKLLEIKKEMYGE